MVRFSHLLRMDHLWEINTTFSESAKIFSPQCPLAELFELVYQCPMLLITVYWKIVPETDCNVNNDSQKSTPSPAFIDACVVLLISW